MILFSLRLFQQAYFVENVGHCPRLGNDSASGFSDAVVGDSLAIDITI